ncbi:MAG: MBL fold metallo-hydrolase [Nocardioidaceae bacterium]
MRLTRYGHAALLVETRNTRILVDPGNFSSDAAFGLTDLDLIAVTHQHPDHADLERLPALLEANRGARLLAEPQIAERLRPAGGDWEDTAPERSVDVGDVRLTGVGGVHAAIHPDLERVGNVGLLLAADDEPTLFHPGDSYEFAPAGVEVLAVPLAAPWAKLSETIDFVRAVGPRIVVPIHDCTIAEVAYPMYWGRVEDMGGAEGRLLAQDGSTTV